MAFAAAFLIAVLVLYATKISRLNYFWTHYPEFKPVFSAPSQTYISVIVAFRNEAAHIGQLMDDMDKQNYPRNMFEIIMVDDGSDDGSDSQVIAFCQSHPNFRYLQNTCIAGKKGAVKTGISNSSYDLIVTTDADCRLQSNWLKTIACFFEENDPDIIIGLVSLNVSGSWFAGYQEAGFFSLVVSGAGAAAEGRPIYSNGANMAFKKEFFNSVQDPMKVEIPSGDDTFLLHTGKKEKKKILLLKSAESLVAADGCASPGEYMHQRIRWASKARFYHDSDTLITAFTVLAMNLAILLTFILFLCGKMPWLFPVFFLIKVYVDYLVVRSYMHYLSKNLLFSIFLLYSLIYPFEILTVALCGILGKYSWKGIVYR